MQKTFQIVRDISFNVGEETDEKNISLRLKENYARCTGFFIVGGTSKTNLDGLTLGLTIDQQEVIPKGSDACLFAVTDTISRGEATYDFKKENIPARSSEVLINVKFDGNAATTSEKEQNVTKFFNAYFILEN